MRLENYKYRGARACVLLHEKYMKEFLEVWKEAKAKGITTYVEGDDDYKSMETLLLHVLRAARGYMTWMCKMLELPDPDIRKVPDVEVIEEQADDYLSKLLAKWEKPLTNVTARQCYIPEFASMWRTKYCIDAMLEHAVSHPIKHTFQLKEWNGE